MRIKKLIISLFTVLISCSVFGQAAVIKGIVANAETRTPLWGVTVYIPELYKGTVTTLKGEYIIEKIPTGSFQIQFSYVGYQTVVKTITTDTDSIILFNVSLIPSVIEAHEIVISTAYSSSQDENPVKVEQMSMQEITKVGAPNLMAAIATLPGINMISTGVGIGKPVIRGLAYNRVLVYSGGVRLENQQWGGEHGLGLTGMGIERIEILKGPASLLYGADAMGGVMHLIEEKSAPVGKIIGDYNVKLNTNTQGLSTNFGIKGSNKSLRFSLRGGLQSHTDYLMGDKIRATNTRFSNDGLKTSLGYLNSHISTKISYNLFHSNVAIYEALGKQTTSRVFTAPFQEITTQIISSQNTFFLGKSKIKLNIGYTTNKRKELEEEQVKQNQTELVEALNMQLNTLTYAAKWVVPKKKTIASIVGIQGLSQSNRNFGQEIVIPNANVNDVGGFVVSKLERNKLITQGGVRYDFRQIKTLGDNKNVLHSFPVFSTNYQKINGSIGFSYHWNTHFLTRFNVASGFRSPNLAELTSNGIHHGANRYEIGDQHLKSEQNVELDLSGHIHTTHATIDIAGFYNQISKFIYLSPTLDKRNGLDVYNYVQDNALLYGGEFSLDIHPHPFDWLHLKSTYSVVEGIHLQGGYLPLIPAGKLQNRLKIEWKNGKRREQTYLTIGVTSVFAKQHVAIVETPTKSYQLLSIGIGTWVKIKNQRIEASVSGNNLLNEVYYSHLSRLKNEGIYNIGRNITFSLKIPFEVPFR